MVTAGGVGMMFQGICREGLSTNRSKGNAMFQTEVQRLLDIEAIKRLKARYCRYLDTKQWQRLPSLFTEDARFDGFASAPAGSDVAAWVDGVSSRLHKVVMYHHCHTPDIDFLDGATARAVWSMAGYLEWPEPIGLEENPQARGMQGFGHYEEEYRKTDGAWKIAHIRFCCMRMSSLRADLPAQRLPVDPVGLGWMPGE